MQIVGVLIRRLICICKFDCYMSHVATYMWTESNKAFCIVLFVLIGKVTVTTSNLWGFHCLRDDPFILQVCKKGLQTTKEKVACLYSDGSATYLLQKCTSEKHDRAMYTP